MIVLDTHALIWYVNEDTRIPETTWNYIHRQDSVLLSSITAWEIAMLVEKERLVLNSPVNEWFRLVGETFPVSWIDITVDICLNSTTLPGEFHSDPADRFIVATCLKFNAKLVTRDQKIQAYPYISTFWD